MKTKFSLREPGFQAYLHLTSHPGIIVKQTKLFFKVDSEFQERIMYKSYQHNHIKHKCLIHDLIIKNYFTILGVMWINKIEKYICLFGDSSVKRSIKIYYFTI